MIQFLFNFGSFTILFHNYYIQFKKKNSCVSFGKLFFVCYLSDFFFPTEHVKHIQARFDFVSWQDGVYAVSAGLVVNVSLLVAGFLVYRLCVRTVKFIGRKWQVACCEIPDTMNVLPFPSN